MDETTSQISSQELQVFKKLGGRKFAIAFLNVLSSSLLMWFGKIDAGVYSAVMIANVGAFIAGNVYQKNITK